MVCTNAVAVLLQVPESCMPLKELKQRLLEAAQQEHGRLKTKAARKQLLQAAVSKVRTGRHP